MTKKAIAHKLLSVRYELSAANSSATLTGAFGQRHTASATQGWSEPIGRLKHYKRALDRRISEPLSHRWKRGCFYSFTFKNPS